MRLNQSDDTKKKLLFCKRLSISIFVLLVLAGGYKVSISIYNYFHPHFFMEKMVNDSEDYHMEFYVLISETVDYSEKYKKQQQEWHEKIMDYQTSLMKDFHKPINVSVSSYTEDGKTIVVFEGNVSDESGNKIDINKQIELSFVLECGS